MTEAPTEYLEIEYKYVLDDKDNDGLIRKAISELGPVKTFQVDVEDSYFYSPLTPDYVFRHRFDREIQQLTMKSITKDPTVRKEVNIALNQDRGSQLAAVHAFLEPLQVSISATIKKRVWAYYFRDVEIVYYEASRHGCDVSCVEIEAIDPETVQRGKELIELYANKLCLDPEMLSSSALFSLLVPEFSEMDLA
ncbi:MAG: CYTH domain-containing protein [Pseudobacteriovorax sp.]|nr:CYTH domain-containing protein [Pseudobacteriovorax sp.]